jgi:hypothetical protein
MLHKPLSLLFLLLSVGCGSGTSPTHAGFGNGTIEARVGPGGGTLRGAGGTPLAGFELRIPEGALRMMVRLRVRIGEQMPVGDSLPASVPIAMSATPDPGALAKPAELRAEIDFPPGRDPGDLFVVGRQTTPATPTARGTGPPWPPSSASTSRPCGCSPPSSAPCPTCRSGGPVSRAGWTTPMLWSGLGCVRWTG